MRKSTAMKLEKILKNKGWNTQVSPPNLWPADGSWHVGIMAKEGQEKEIRNSIPIWMWFLHHISSQTIHEKNNKIIIVLNSKW